MGGCGDEKTGWVVRTNLGVAACRGSKVLMSPTFGAE